MGPLASRLSRDMPGPWMTGCGPKCGTEHRNRPFIAGNTNSRHEENPANNWSNQEASDMEDEEEGERVSEDDISTNELEDELTNRQSKEQE